MLEFKSDVIKGVSSAKTLDISSDKIFYLQQKKTNLIKPKWFFTKLLVAHS